MAQPKLTLYHAAPSRSSIVLWMLEEIGAPCDLHLLKLKAGDQLSPEYRALNPMGRYFRHNAMHAGTTRMVLDEFGRCAKCVKLGWWKPDA